eukprot:scaffold12697_cov103-Skeletonema_menzelii.AAC.1
MDCGGDSSMKFGRVVGVECRIGWLFGGQCGWIANFAVCGFIPHRTFCCIHRSLVTTESSGNVIFAYISSFI